MRTRNLCRWCRRPGRSQSVCVDGNLNGTGEIKLVVEPPRFGDIDRGLIEATLATANFGPIRVGKRVCRSPVDIKRAVEILTCLIEVIAQHVHPAAAVIRDVIARIKLE